MPGTTEFKLVLIHSSQELEVGGRSFVVSDSGFFILLL